MGVRRLEQKAKITRFRFRCAVATLSLLCLVRWFPSKLRVYSQTPESGKKKGIIRCIVDFSVLTAQRSCVDEVLLIHTPIRTFFDEISSGLEDLPVILLPILALRLLMMHVWIILFLRCVRFHQIFIPIDNICYGNDECASMTSQQ